MLSGGRRLLCLTCREFSLRSAELMVNRAIFAPFALRGGDLVAMHTGHVSCVLGVRNAVRRGQQPHLIVPYLETRRGQIPITASWHGTEHISGFNKLVCLHGTSSDTIRVPGCPRIALNRAVDSPGSQSLPWTVFLHVSPRQSCQWSGSSQGD